MTWKHLLISGKDKNVLLKFTVMWDCESCGAPLASLGAPFVSFQLLQKSILISNGNFAISINQLTNIICCHL